jgi:hypothetical protein
MAWPFLSRKAYRKVQYIAGLHELETASGGHLGVKHLGEHYLGTLS